LTRNLVECPITSRDMSTPYRERSAELICPPAPTELGSALSYIAEITPAYRSRR